MTDRVYPAAAKPPAANGVSPAVNGTAPVANGATPLPPAAAKPQLYRPYRPQPASHRRRHRRRCNLCCCCFWTVLAILILALIAAIAGAAFYVLYKPHRPNFAILSLRIGTLNLTTDSTAASSRLSTSFNLTLSSKNPNSHYFTFSYDPFAVTFLSGDVPIGNSTLPAFLSNPKNQTVFKNVVVSARTTDLDTDAVKSLLADLRRPAGIPLTIQLDTMVKVKAGKLKSKRVGIRVACEGFKGVAAPKGKSPVAATVGDAHCKVDLRLKIWKFTF